MPLKSKAQGRLMHAAAEGRSSKVSKKDAKKFLRHGSSTKGLPERKKKR